MSASFPDASFGITNIEIYLDTKPTCLLLSYAGLVISNASQQEWPV